MSLRRDLLVSSRAPATAVARLFCRAVLLAAILVSSCSDSGTDPSGPFSGDYTLQTVNGGPLPWVASDGTFVITAMRLSVRADGGYTLSVDVAPGSLTGPLPNESGRWNYAPESGTVRLRNSSNVMWASGTASGDVLTLSTTDTTRPTETYVFRR